MLPRIWIALLAVLLLAAPADGTFAEHADAQASSGLCDDAAAMPVQAPPAERAPARAARVTRRADVVPPAPELARVFRPPRPSSD